MSVAEMARKRGLTPSAVYSRVRRGMSLGWALRKPLGHAGNKSPSESDNMDLRDDVLAGESSAATIAERHGLNERTVVRIRGRLRALGYRVRVPEQWP